MAKIFKPGSKVKNRKHQSTAKQLPDFEVTIEKYDHELKGIATGLDNRITFVPGTMVGEKVRVKATTYTDRLIHADVKSQITTSEQRIAPSCPHFSHCGGCQLQYMSSEDQLQQKQNAVDNLMRKQLNLDELPWQKNITSSDWQYRRTAKMVTWRDKSGNFSMGFRAQGDKQVVDLEQCPILTTKLASAFGAIKPIMANLTPTKQFPQVTGFDLESGVYLIIRALRSLTNEESKRLLDLETELQCRIWLEHEKGQYSALNGSDKEAEFLLEYRYENYRYTFSPSDFIQINAAVNSKMIEQAIEWLNVQSDETVLDLFSGVGNFTLPLADRAKSVFAVEGVSNMVAKLKHNSKLNGLSNISAHQADLSQIDDKRRPRWLKPIDKLLLDPARDGALDVVKKIPLLSPKQILYVSCNPVTMSRDLKYLLTNEYRLTKIALLNMFPHTSHVEAMALLEKRT